jgi:hypothetical protein
MALRARLLLAIEVLMPVALLYSWLAPEGGGWRIGAAVIGAPLIGALLAFGVVWLRDHRRRDPSAVLDARFVLAVGAVPAFLAALLVEQATGSTSTATIVCVVLLIPALGAYVYVAARTP